MTKAKVIISVLIAIAGISAAAAPKAIPAARELLLKRDRVGASQLLVDAFAKSSGQSKIEIARELERLTTVFLTEQGQKNYELAESMLYEAQSGAEAKYEEALVLEPGNVQVLLGLVRAKMNAGDCAGANEKLNEIEKMNPISLEKKIFRYKTTLCLKKPLVGVENDPSFKGDMKVALKLIQIENLYNIQKIKEALAHLKDIQSNPLPEISYWQYKLHENEPALGTEAAQKYADICKSLSPAMRRQFKLEPRLCKKTEEVEEYIARNEEKK